MKIILSILLLCCVVCQNQEDIEISILCGYGNTLPKKSSLQPVLVSLKNKSTALIKGYLILSQTNFLGASNGRFYRQEITLPGNSYKILKYHILLCNSHSQISATLQTQDQKFEGSASVKVIQGLNLWINWKNKIDKYKMHENTYYSICDTPIELFPDKLEALSNVSVMFIGDPRLFSINEQQQQVLKKWIYKGGNLIFASSLGFENNIEKIVPFAKPNFPQQRDYKETELGFGRIICFAKGEDHSSFLLRKDNKHFIVNVLKCKKSYVANYGSELQEHMNEKLGGKVEFTWMVLLLVCYLFCIGPFDYFLTKKLKRRMLTWWIYIISIILFSCLAYIKGYVLKSGPMKMECINFLDVYEDEIHGKTVCGIYSTRNATYKLKTAITEGYFVPLNDEPTTDTEVFDISEEQNPVSTRIPIYSSKSYISVWQKKAKTYPQTIELNNRKQVTINIPEDFGISSGYVIHNAILFKISMDRDIWSAEYSGSTFDREQLMIKYSGKYYGRQNIDISSVERMLSTLETSKNKVVIILFCDAQNYVTIEGENPIRTETSALRFIVSSK